MEVSGMKRNYCKSCGKVMNKASTYSEGFCSKCEEEISQRRFDTHKQFKLNREHRIVQSVEAKSKSKETPTFGCCIEHLDKGIIYFCLEHDQVCCVECMLVSHLSCNKEYIFKHFDGYKDSEELKKDTEKYDIEAKAMLGSIRRNKKLVKDVNKKFAHDVISCRDEVISHIMKLADAMLKHGDDIMVADLEKIKNLEKESKSLVDETNGMRDKLQSEADQPYKFVVTSSSNKQIIHLVHEKLERMKQSNTIETYDFTPDCNLRQLITTYKQLGTLHRSNFFVHNQFYCP
jgi:hypothetical protein